MFITFGKYKDHLNLVVTPPFIIFSYSGIALNVLDHLSKDAIAGTAIKTQLLVPSIFLLVEDVSTS